MQLKFAVVTPNVNRILPAEKKRLKWTINNKIADEYAVYNEIEQSVIQILY